MTFNERTFTSVRSLLSAANCSLLFSIEPHTMFDRLSLLVAALLLIAIPSEISAGSCTGEGVFDGDGTFNGEGLFESDAGTFSGRGAFIGSNSASFEGTKI